MSFFDFITRLFGIVPKVIDAAEQVANAVKTTRPINPDDATLWHTVESRIDSTMKPPRWYRFCTVCQRAIPKGFETQLCSEAVRRRNADLT